MTRPAPLQAWHAIAEARDPAGLAELLAEDVTFRSPAVHTPQEGKALTTAYLTAAIAVLGPSLAYLREWYDDSSAVLEFRAELDGQPQRALEQYRAGARAPWFEQPPCLAAQACLRSLGAELAGR